MATIPVRIINPTKRRRKNAVQKRKVPVSISEMKPSKDVGSKRYYKHRPVFYSRDPERLGERPAKRVLNKPRKKRKLKNKSSYAKEVKEVAYKKKTRRGRKRVRNRAAKSTTRKTTRKRTSNPAKIRSRTRTIYANRSKKRSKRRNRNPNTSMAPVRLESMAGQGIAAVGAGAATMFVPSFWNMQGNKKFLAQGLLTLGFWFGLRWFGLKRYAYPAALGSAVALAISIAQDKGFLLGNVFSTQDAYNTNYLSRAANTVNGAVVDPVDANVIRGNVVPPIQLEGSDYGNDDINQYMY